MRVHCIISSGSKIHRKGKWNYWSCMCNSSSYKRSWRGEHERELYFINPWSVCACTCAENNSKNIKDEEEPSNEVLKLSRKKCKIKRRDNACYLNFEATYMENLEDEIYVDEVVNEDVSDSHNVVKCIP